MYILPKLASKHHTLVPVLALLEVGVQCQSLPHKRNHHWHLLRLVDTRCLPLAQGKVYNAADGLM